MGEAALSLYCKVMLAMRWAFGHVGDARRDESGQGTTEYAILVGVIVVIAILAVALFRGKLQELWDAIVNGINSL